MNPENQELVRKFAAEGLCKAEISRELGVSRATVLRACKAMGVSARVGNKDLPTTFEQFKSRIEDMKADEAIETLLFAIEGLLKDERAPLPFDAGEGAFSPKQRALLGFLHRHKGVVTKERIMSALYLGEDDPPHSDIVAVLVCHVRKKLPDHIDIANVHGVGYELRVAEVAK